MAEQPDRTYSLEEAMDSLGFGRYQVLLMFVCGAWWAADAMEVMVVSFIMPILRDEWNLDGFQEGLVGSCVFFGLFLGTFVWGVASDNWGRKKGYLAVAVCCSIFGLASAFAPNLGWMLALRGLLGFGIGGSPVAFSMFSEFLPTKSRGRFLIIFEVFWVVGTLLEAALAWIILPRAHWVWLIGISAVPFFVLAALYPFIPESPRYLAVSGKRNEARQVLERVAKWNKKALPEGDLRVAAAQEFSWFKVGQLFSPSLRRLTIVLWFIWFAHSLVYYGLVLFTPEYFRLITHEPLSGAPADATPNDAPNTDDSNQLYLLVFIATLGELPGLILTGFLVDKIGRKLIITIFLALASLCLFAMLFNPGPWVAIFLLLGGRMFVNGSWASAWTYTPEAYPTVVRATGLGAANGLSKFASIFTPFLSTVLVDVAPSMPLIIFGVTALLAAGSTFLLPFDTSQLRLEDSLPKRTPPDTPPMPHYEEDGADVITETSSLRANPVKRTPSTSPDLDVVI